MNIKDVLIKKISVGERWRTPSIDEIKSIAESIKEVGCLLEPIGLNKDHSLIYGLTRIEACKLLGWQKIPAIMHDVDPDTAKYMEHCENLKRRKPGTALEESEELSEMKKVFEKMHPQSKHGGNRTSPAEVASGKNCHLKSFAEETAKATGQSERTIRDKVAVAESIPSTVAAIIKDTPLADNRAELKRLGNLPEDQKLPVAKAIQSGNAETVKEAVATLPAKSAEPHADILAKMKADNAIIDGFSKRLKAIYKEVEESDLPLINDTCVQGILKSAIDNASGILRAAKGHDVCPYCQGKWCKHCHKTGYVTKEQFESAPQKRAS